MRIAVDHRTRYRFSEPQARLVELLRLTPGDTLDQSVISWRIDVDRDARLRAASDGFGNRTTMLYVEGPVDSLEIAVTGEVLTTPSDGMVRNTIEPLPPELYLRQTARTRPGLALAGFVAQLNGGTIEARLDRLVAALRARVTPARADRDDGATAEDAFQDASGTPRDLAQMFIAAARSVDIPARYVSGYSVHAGDGAQPAPHAWAEACLGEAGWMAFDPWMGSRADEAYVRVAIGLDATGVAPIIGARIGAGEELLDVDLHVQRLTGDT